MNRKKGAVLFFAVMLWCFSAVLAQAADSRLHPETGNRIKEIKKIGILLVGVKIYELTAGGVRELRDDWSTTGRQNFVNALTDFMKDKPVEFTVLAIDKGMTEEIEDMQTLYAAVADAIVLHTYPHSMGLYMFPEKVKTFEYSIGPIDSILRRLGVDALLLVNASDEISSGGRKALMVVGAFTGVHPRSGITFASMSLIDGRGAVLWFNANVSGAAFDLRDPGDVTKFAGRMLREFPRFER